VFCVLYQRRLHVFFFPLLFSYRARKRGHVMGSVPYPITCIAC
jgi:hypothetical protein